MKKTITLKLVLNRAVRKTYPDKTYWEYIIFESPFDPGTYDVHISFGHNGEKHEDSHTEVYFPQHSMVSKEFGVNGNEYHLKLLKQSRAKTWEARTDGTNNSYFNIINIMENIRCNRTYIYSDFSRVVYARDVDSFPNDHYVHLGTNCNILFYRTSQL